MTAKSNERQMILGWLLDPTGTHASSWMIDQSERDPRTDFANYKAMAEEAERAKLHFIFQADWPSVRPGPPERIARVTSYNVWFEPVSLMSALASITSKIGLVGTGSTSFNEPYNLARQFSTLDHISEGRAGWNIVTSRSPIAGMNYGRDEQIPHSDRYKRGEEFVDVVKGLWDSYEDDAIVRDVENGLYFDPKKLHTLDYKSDQFNVLGPLNISRSPQGYPVMFQAGASPTGITLGARVADVIFCIHRNIEDMQNFSEKVRAQAVEFGRLPSAIKICNAFDVVVKRTATEADEAVARLDAMLHPESIKQWVSDDIEADITDLDLDDLITVDRLPKIANSSKSADSVIRKWLEEKPMSVREMYDRFKARSAVSVHGDPIQVADKMEEWFTSGATDGFMLFFPLPSGMRDFNELVVPELQRRGLFHTDYSGTTLRENLNLPRPEHPNTLV
jgi:FMN-dependent oxidoreductase (nitrilotriacetate monooxygenase family)